MTHIRSFPDGARLVLFDPRILKNVHDVTFYRYKINIYLGMGIMTYCFKTKQLAEYQK